MRILAIDPGPEMSAFVVWDGTRVHERNYVDNPVMLPYLALPNFFDLLAIEKIESYGMAVGASTFDTCYWIGRFDPLSAALLVPRREIKLHLCHSARAKDANVRQALIDRFGKPGTKKSPGPLYGIASHLWSALAVAVTVYDGLKKKEGK